MTVIKSKKNRSKMNNGPRNYGIHINKNVSKNIMVN